MAWHRRIRTTAALATIYGWLSRWWPAVIGAVIPAGIASWAATASAWLDQYGPISWVFAALGAGLVGTVIVWGVTMTVLSVAKFLYYRDITKTKDQVNPLEDIFQKREFNIQMFFNPFLEPNKHKSFIGCRIYGPGKVMFLSGTITNYDFRDCEFIKIKRSDVKNCIIFEDITLSDCMFYRLTVFVPPDMIETFRDVPDEYWLN